MPLVGVLSTRMPRHCRRKGAQCRPLVVERIWTVSPRNPRLYGLGPLPGFGVAIIGRRKISNLYFVAWTRIFRLTVKVTGLLLRGRTILWNMQVCDVRASQSLSAACGCIEVPRHRKAPQAHAAPKSLPSVGGILRSIPEGRILRIFIVCFRSSLVLGVPHGLRYRSSFLPSRHDKRFITRI